MTQPPPAEIIVTGLHGLVGSALATHPAAARLALTPLGGGERVDITLPDAVEAAIDGHPGARVLLHLAAFTDTAAAHAQQGDREGACYRVNVLGTRHLAQACAARGLHLVSISTDFIFAGDRDAPLREDDPPAPIDWYGETKWLGECEVREIPAWTIVRLSFPYGTTSGSRDLLAKILARLRRGDTLNLFDDQIITPTWLRDIAAGLAALVQSPPPGETFHLVGSEWTTPFDFGRAVADAFGLNQSLINPGKLDALVRAEGRPRHRSLRMDNTKWSAFARSRGLEAPLGVAAALSATRADTTA